MVQSKMQRLLTWGARLTPGQARTRPCRATRWQGWAQPACVPGAPITTTTLGEGRGLAGASRLARTLSSRAGWAPRRRRPIPAGATWLRTLRPDLDGEANGLLNLLAVIFAARIRGRAGYHGRAVAVPGAGARRRARPRRLAPLADLLFVGLLFVGFDEALAPVLKHRSAQAVRVARHGRGAIKAIQSCAAIWSAPCRRP